MASSGASNVGNTGVSTVTVTSGTTNCPPIPTVSLTTSNQIQSAQSQQHITSSSTSSVGQVKIVSASDRQKQTSTHTLSSNNVHISQTTNQSQLDIQTIPMQQQFATLQPMLLHSQPQVLQIQTNNEPTSGNINQPVVCPSLPLIRPTLQPETKNHQSQQQQSNGNESLTVPPSHSSAQPPILHLDSYQIQAQTVQSLVVKQVVPTQPLPQSNQLKVVPSTHSKIITVHTPSTVVPAAQLKLSSMQQLPKLASIQSSGQTKLATIHPLAQPKLVPTISSVQQKLATIHPSQKRSTPSLMQTMAASQQSNNNVPLLVPTKNVLPSISVVSNTPRQGAVASAKMPTASQAAAIAAKVQLGTAILPKKSQLTLSKSISQTTPRTKQTPRKNITPAKTTNTNISPKQSISVATNNLSCNIIPLPISTNVSPVSIHVVSKDSTVVTQSTSKSGQDKNSPIAADMPKSGVNKVQANALESSTNDVSIKIKRHRLKTIPYQSPLPELALITKISASEASSSSRGSDDNKLTLFYKNEYLAVRNAEGGFFLCQSMQNVYKSSPKIRIRWLSEEKIENTYIPDFYDTTDIECVLTNVTLEKIGKTKNRKQIYNLPMEEKVRILNILNRAIDVEKGILPKPTVTEENPDGLDLSLYTDESQIELKNNRRSSTRISKHSPHTKRRKLNESSEQSDGTDDEYIPGRKRGKGSPISLRKRRGTVKNYAEDNDDEEEVIVVKRTTARGRMAETIAATTAKDINIAEKLITQSKKSPIKKLKENVLKSSVTSTLPDKESVLTNKNRPFEGSTIGGRGKHKLEKSNEDQSIFENKASTIPPAAKKNRMTKKVVAKLTKPSPPSKKSVDLPTPMKSRVTNQNTKSKTIGKIITNSKTKISANIQVPASGRTTRNRK